MHAQGIVEENKFQFPRCRAARFSDLSLFFDIRSDRVDSNDNDDANRHDHECQHAKAEPEQPPCAETAQPNHRIQANTLKLD